MRKMTRKAIAGISIVVLVVAMVLPSVALAAPEGAGTGAVADAGAQQLEQRVINALRNRAQRFENYANMLELQEERLLELCEKVEAAGGDCDQVREQIREATQTMEQARTQEKLAADMFKEVPDAGNRRGAFTQARDQARTAVRTMKQSRDQLRAAAGELREIVGDLLDDAAETDSE